MSESSKATEQAGSNNAERQALVVTAVGPDRSGLVKDLASYVRERGGNIEDTRMSKLGGEFAVLLLVTGSEEALSRLEQVEALEKSLSISCFTKRTNTAPPEGALYELEASGFDQPGIVEAVSQVLAEKKVNVTSFSSRVENVPLTGTLMFFLNAEIALPAGVLVHELEGALAATCERENLEYILQKA